jgi:hypothetical protein
MKTKDVADVIINQDRAGWVLNQVSQPASETVHAFDPATGVFDENNRRTWFKARCGRKVFPIRESLFWTKPYCMRCTTCESRSTKATV